LLLRDADRLARILTNAHYPVQLVIAGKAHPKDVAGQQLVKAWFQFMQRPEIRRHALFIGDYDMLVAERLVQGVDVWMNTPRRPWEASGTSGMKVLANGGLNLSELDGWWAEAYSEELGWALGDGEEHGSDEAWDEQEAEALYSLLEDCIVPEFYRRDARGIPRAWVARMRASMARLTPRYSTNRAIREYTEKYYLPCAERYRRRAADGGRTAVELFEWSTQLSRHWSSLHFGDVAVDTDGDDHLFQVPAYLGELDHEAVAIQLYADPFAHEPAFCISLQRSYALTGAANGFMYTGRAPGLRPVGNYAVRAVAHRADAIVPLEAGHILWRE
jgi:starch phosphorylase